MNPSFYIEYLQNTLGLPELALDEDGCCVLTFDKMPVTLQATATGIIMTSFIAQLTEPIDPDLLKQLLAANLYWQGSKGCTLALEPDSLSIVAHIQSTEDVSAIETQLATLVDVTESFGIAIRQYEIDVSAQPDAPSTEGNIPPLNKV